MINKYIRNNQDWHQFVHFVKTLMTFIIDF